MFRTKTRRRININKQGRLIERKCSKHCLFKEHLEQMNKDLRTLMEGAHVVKDPKFLRRMAINIKHLHHEAKKMQQRENLRALSSQIIHFLSTPLGAPFVAKETLVNAAYLFSEQDPNESDLRMILGEFAFYGTRYPLQLLSSFSY